MRSEVKGYKRSKVDCRLLCGELRLRADTEEDALLLAALTDYWLYHPRAVFDLLISGRAKKFAREVLAKKKAEGGEK